MRKVASEHSFCVLINVKSCIFHICFIFIYFIVISNILFCMLDVIIGRHTWNCQIRTHIHTGYTHTRTHTKKGKKEVGRLEKKERKSMKTQKTRGGGVRKERKKGKRKD